MGLGGKLRKISWEIASPFLSSPTLLTACSTEVEGEGGRVGNLWTELLGRNSYGFHFSSPIVRVRNLFGLSPLIVLLVHQRDKKINTFFLNYTYKFETQT